MPEVHQPPPGGKGGDPSPALDPTKPAVFRAWLTALRAHADDLYAAGEDATRPLGHRDLGRRTARKAICDARAAIGDLLSTAERGLDA